MNSTHDGSPGLGAIRRRSALALAVGLMLIAVAACGSKDPKTQAAEELTAGLAASAAGNTAEASKRYRACLELDTTNKYCIFNLGVIAQGAGQVAEAENAYRLALLLDPNMAPALYNLAIIRANAGSSAEAIAIYRHLIEVDPGNSSGHFNLGLALVNAGQTEAGLKELQVGVSLNPNLVIPSPLPRATGVADSD